MPALDQGPSPPDPALRGQIRQLHATDNATNLAYLAREYASMAAVAAGAISFVEFRATLGLGRAWEVPVLGLAVVLMGALQHRLAGLGHEALHYSLLKNRFWNDLVGDVFCMLPLMTNVRLYRAFHMAHHRHTNDAHRDPEVVHMGRGKCLGRFPMTPRHFILNFHLAPLAAPGALIRYGWAYFYVTALGGGVHLYRRRSEGGEVAGPGLSPATVLGTIYLIGFAALVWILVSRRMESWIAPVTLFGLLAVGSVAGTLPRRAYIRSPFLHAYPARVSGALRLGYYTVVMAVLARLDTWSDGRATVYALLLWGAPLGTTFLYFMRLRDVYQHANAGEGPLTNSRVFRCGPLARWAIFVYGQDMHLTHHLFPAVPHHRLGTLDDLLRREHPEYATRVAECHGTFANGAGRPTILAILAAGPSRPPSRAGTSLGE